MKSNKRKKQKQQKTSKGSLPNRAAAKATPKQDSLVDFLRRTPLYGAKLDMSREDDFCRDIDL